MVYLLYYSLFNILLKIILFLINLLFFLIKRNQLGKNTYIRFNFINIL